jgi:hypothetical protein
VLRFRRIADIEACRKVAVLVLKDAFKDAELLAANRRCLPWQLGGVH